MTGGPLRRLQELAAGLRWQAGTPSQATKEANCADARQVPSVLRLVRPALRPNHLLRRCIGEAFNLGVTDGD
jgi:hypothetical protein